jgi:hypothetical protein
MQWEPPHRADDPLQPVWDWLGRHWRAMLVLFWLLLCAWMLVERAGAIRGFALPDTDDNLRIAQVRAWLAGQDWFDLRQMKLNPPGGFNIHWSRIVDLPIAALILGLRPFVGGVMAEKAAVAIAPMLPLLLAMFALALAARRLVAPGAWLLAAALLPFAHGTMGMFRPLRIDHHGWQLALLALTIAALADPRRGRGGMIVGIASAVSLAIGLELLPYIAVAGASIVLRWIVHAEARPRMLAYALSFGLATIIAYVGFASYANHQPLCDALTPVWLTTVAVACLAVAAIAIPPAESWQTRLALAGLAGAAALAFFWFAWPGCHGRPEGVSPELYRLWLGNVREAKPLFAQDWPLFMGLSVLPALGLGGAGFCLWRARGSEAFYPWLSVIVMSVFSVVMLLWQVRAGPASQLIALFGCAGLIWPLVLRARASTRMAVRVAVPAALLSAVPAASMVSALPIYPKSRPGPLRAKINRASRLCPTLAALAPIARLPATTIFTFVDLGPRLIAVTHHKAIAGPYHRNGDAILDVHHAFDGTPQQAQAIMRAHGATHLLVCPYLPESTIYKARSPNGFYARLQGGERFGWLTPVPLPKGSPYWLWRLDAGAR